MSKYYFPGFPSFFKAAAEINNLPGLVSQAHRWPALAAMANLCAQAVEAEPKDANEILAKASEFLDHLMVAKEAAEMMLEAVRLGLGGGWTSPSEASEDQPGPESSDPRPSVPKAGPEGEPDRA